MGRYLKSTKAPLRAPGIVSSFLLERGLDSALCAADAHGRFFGGGPQRGSLCDIRWCRGKKPDGMVFRGTTLDSSVQEVNDGSVLGAD